MMPLGVLLLSSVAGPIDPDAGIVINWKALDAIVRNYTHAPPDGWLAPPLDNCSLPEFVAAPPVLNLGGLAHESYRPLFCTIWLGPFNPRVVASARAAAANTC
jgi:hypothetical protein